MGNITARKASPEHFAMRLAQKTYLNSIPSAIQKGDADGDTTSAEHDSGG